MKEEIRNFIAETTFCDPTSISDETLIFDEGIFDSMGLLGLISFLESEYNITAEDTELQEENFGSVERIAAYIEKKKAA
ncbi:D-alanine-poly(phosphoribitol) ligase subunit 2 [Saccharicrinis fermentans DSM 9555 = JCM 21142]|uniref:D-alanine-poly(Phosphoribitol) ligase subunit 2 n=2 Tax=Saccharicrinis fermentans TaxID=982 RepID=W7YLP3_9BACT|nr:D-alanine-poly(phosphoribitol) ligase subunit 2 [Saccharicrinis fermentans DSM 9555 = JCM 21142]